MLATLTSTLLMAAVKANDRRLFWLSLRHYIFTNAFAAILFSARPAAAA
jgi:hypothetical protein